MPDLSSLGATTAGVWTRRAARRLLTAGEIDGFVRRGEWQVPWPGVYADAGVELNAVQRAFAVVLASGGEGQAAELDEEDEGGGPASASGGGAATPDGARTVQLRAVAAGRTAARVWGFSLVDDDDPATGRHEHLLDEVAVWTRARPVRWHDAWGRPRVLQRRRLRFGAGDIRRLSSGLWVTGPGRTLYDLAGQVRDDALVCAMDDALHRRVLTPSQLATAGGVRRHRRFLAAVGLTDGRAESPGESLTRLLLQPVLPGLTPQVRVLDERGRILARLDLGEQALRLAVEFDGRATHSGERMYAKDQRRDVVTGRYGWTTERVTWWQVRRQQAATRQRVLATAAALQAERTPRRAG